MICKRFSVLVALFALIISSFCAADGLENDWNDFLHYTAIGKYDLASGYGQRIVASEPNPVEPLELSQSNQKGYKLLLKIYADSPELKDVAGQILDIIEKGRFELRTSPKIIAEEIRRLSTTIRGRIAAEEHLRNSGEYAVPLMIGVLADKDRESEYGYVTQALPKIGRPAIRPLVAALQTTDIAVKTEIVRALGKIGYDEPVAYLKYIIENDSSVALKEHATIAIQMIDANKLKVPAAELFFQLGEMYYNKAESVAASDRYDFGNVWFWDADAKSLIRKEIDKQYFNEMMAMRCCEWAVKADPSTAKAIALWISAFFRAESYGVAMPEYFGVGHADAMTYATTAGAEYLHMALERALNDQDDYVSLGVVEAMAVNAGEKSLLYQIGTEQPLAKALSYKDKKVAFSAAIALAEAGPRTEFVGSSRIMENLSEAILEEQGEVFGAELASEYAFRAIKAIRKLSIERSPVVDLQVALNSLTTVSVKSNDEMKKLAAEVLAYQPSPEAQRAIAEMAMNEANSKGVRLSAFASLAVSAKVNANQLLSSQIEKIYGMVSSMEADAELRAGAAGAYGALNLPSQQVKQLILDQAKS